MTARISVFDVSMTFTALVICMLLGLIIIVLLGRCLGVGDLGLYRITSTIYGIAMLVAAVGIPAAMIKYVAEFKDDMTKWGDYQEKILKGVRTMLNMDRNWKNPFGDGISSRIDDQSWERGVI